jgi:hypothetical protein
VPAAFDVLSGVLLPLGTEFQIPKLDSNLNYDGHERGGAHGRVKRSAQRPILRREAHAQDHDDREIGNGDHDKKCVDRASAVSGATEILYDGIRLCAASACLMDDVPARVRTHTRVTDVPAHPARVRRGLQGGQQCPNRNPALPKLR